MKKAVINVGQTFGRLQVIAEQYGLIRKNGSIRRVFLCECSCGKTKTILLESLVSGHTESCGCLREESVRLTPLIHGHTKHGAVSREYNTWSLMKKRCSNPADAYYAVYGGRGIAVCERWHKFENFLADMGSSPSPAHSIERKDNDGNYEPGNCIWATKKEQARNRRSNTLIEIDGQTKCIAEWGEITGKSPMLISARIYIGWSPREAVLFPVGSRRENKS